MEGAWEVETGNLVSLSEQQFIDCSKENDGCDGGSMPLAFEYGESSQICTEASYSYTATAGLCESSSCDVGIPQGGITGFKSVGHTEEDLLSAIELGPVAVAIQADQISFQLYAGGVLHQACLD